MQRRRAADADRKKIQREKKSMKEGRTQLVVPTAELSLTEL